MRVHCQVLVAPAVCRCGSSLNETCMLVCYRFKHTKAKYRASTFRLICLMALNLLLHFLGGPPDGLSLSPALCPQPTYGQANLSSGINSFLSFLGKFPPENNPKPSPPPPAD